MLKVTFQPKALLEYINLQQDRKMMNKINALLKDIARHPQSGLGKPESLRGDLSGHYSRRIDEKNRIIYRFDDEKCEIVQVGLHYDDK